MYIRNIKTRKGNEKQRKRKKFHTNLSETE